MRPGKIGSLTSVLVVGWLAACGSSFSGDDAAGGSGGQAGSSGKGAGGAGNKGGSGSTGKGGNTSGGSGATGGSVVGTGGDIGSAGEGVINPGMAGAEAGGAPSTSSSCRIGALADVLFCDDFENPALPDWAHLQSAGDDGLTEHVTEPVHLGEGAVKSTKYSAGSLDPLVTDELGQNTSGRLYARVWMYIPGDVAISNDPLANASLLVLGEGPPSDGGVSLAMWANNKTTIQIYNPNNATALAQAAAFQTPLPLDTWFCARLDFPIGDSVASSEFKLRINEDVLVSSEPEKVVNSTLSAPYQRLWLGVNYLSPQQASAVTVYYDDVAVSTTDLPCE